VVLKMESSITLPANWESNGDKKDNNPLAAILVTGSNNNARGMTMAIMLTALLYMQEDDHIGSLLKLFAADSWTIYEQPVITVPNGLNSQKLSGTWASNPAR